jgi:hypothetical protein
MIEFTVVALVSLYMLFIALFASKEYRAVALFILISHCLSISLDGVYRDMLTTGSGLTGVKALGVHCTLACVAIVLFGRAMWVRHALIYLGIISMYSGLIIEIEYNYAGFFYNWYGPSVIALILMQIGVSHDATRSALANCMDSPPNFRNFLQDVFTFRLHSRSDRV